MARSDFVGVDGCKGGWFSVGFDRDGCCETAVFPTFGELLAHYAGAKLILVDIPIGLPESKGGRDCDRKARKLLGRRRSSVFPTPTRQTVQQAFQAPKDYRAAVRTENRAAGKGISQQAFAIAPKIAEVDEVIRARGPGAEPLVREVHPELLFCALNRAKPMESPKKRAQGRVERLCVLRREEPRTQEIYDKTRAKFRRNVVANDDIVDALAAAVVAHHHHGQLRTLPECPPKDPKGLPMEIVYPG